MNFSSKQSALSPIKIANTRYTYMDPRWLWNALYEAMNAKIAHQNGDPIDESNGVIAF